MKQSIKAALMLTIAQTVGQPNPTSLALSTEPHERKVKRPPNAKSSTKSGKAKRKARKKGKR